MNIYSPEKPMIGTLFEMAWAYDKPGTMIIGIFDGDPKENFICNHPFVSQSIQTWVQNEKEACLLLDRFMDVPEMNLDFAKKLAMPGGRYA
jgi:hypothetical protein